MNICIDYDKFYTYSFNGIVEFIINNKLNINIDRSIVLKIKIMNIILSLF